MAKKKTPEQKRTKTEEIRQVLKSGIHKPTEVQATLAGRGIEVSPQMVSTVKSKMSARRSARKIGRRRASANGAAPATDIKTLARFILAVHDLGGVADARKVLVEMEE
jgi:hypothetical protein